MSFRAVFWAVLVCMGVIAAGCGGEMVADDAGTDAPPGCTSGAECESGVCGADGQCADPACDDGAQNGDETDVDCGAGCAPCEDGRMCGEDGDCASGRCAAGTCAPALLATGESCTEDDECESADCRAFGDSSVCTEACTTTCPGEMLACFEGLCTPRDYCENADGFGDGPGCTGTVCDACAASATCVELTGGGFECMCNDGYTGDGRTCADDDECALGTDTCGANATCANTEGSFTCVCDAGYTGDGATCTDEDECTLGTHTCGAGAICTNTEGSFTCACSPGYSGDGMTCVDVDECTAGSHTCHADATCMNTPGSYDCRCNPGFTGDGRSCTPALESYVAWVGDTRADGSVDVVVAGLPGAAFTTPAVVNPITTFGNAPTSASFTSFSPDGTKIAFRGDFVTDGVQELFVVDLSRSSPGAAQVVSGPMVTGGNVVNFVWSPDSRRLVYTADQDTDTVTELYVVDVSGPIPGPSQKVSGPMVTGGDIQSGDFGWSPDGARIAYQADQLADTVLELFVVDVSGATPGTAQRVNGTLTSGGDVDDRWVWTPDGARIVYEADQDTDGVFEVYLVDVSGAAPSAPVKVSGAMTSGGSVGTAVTDLAISFDGRWVSYVADQITDAVEEVFVVDISGGSPGAPVLVSGTAASFTDNINLTWSPTAARLVYASDQDTSGSYEVYFVDLSGAAPTPAVKIHPAFQPLGRVAAGADEVKWSPDGRWVAYRADTTVDNAFEVEVVDLSTGTPSAPIDAMPPRMTGLTTDDFAFAPDSSAIAARGEGLVDEADELFVTTLGGTPGTPVSVTGVPMATGGQVLGFLWVGDSRHLLVRGDLDVDTETAAYLIDTTAVITPPPRLSTGIPPGGDVSAIFVRPR